MSGINKEALEALETAKARMLDAVPEGTDAEIESEVVQESGDDAEPVAEECERGETPAITHIDELPYLPEDSAVSVAEAQDVGGPDQSEEPAAPSPWDKAVQAKKPRNTRRRKRIRNGGHDGPSAMIYLDTEPLPPGVTVDNIEEAINLPESPLAMDALSPIELPFGRAISVRRAADALTHPKMRESHMMKRKLSRDEMGFINSKVNSIPNYWAAVAYIALERIMQSPDLVALLEEDREIVSVELRKINTFRGETTTLVPNTADRMYIGVIRELARAIRNTVGEDKETRVGILEMVLKQLRRDDTVSIFEGTSVIIEGL